ncbi:transcription termination factor 2 [Astyanax mexicanus]|uniref:transcription termination factor 2 n=1 Tax=Astyanax mexicanus TaxID=7994 RepID=UPI0020CB5EE1|nr:transcription termination factor 2 [Astyanax mexicanus]
MQRVLCDKHGGFCLLKTGVKEGPNKGKSFYVCTARDETPCTFAQPAEVPPSHCLLHEDALVELQAVIHNEKQNNYKLLYRCVTGKKEGQKWCGSIPWLEKDTERSPLSDKKNHHSSLPPVRNPFKAPSKVDQTSEWRKLQEGKAVKGEVPQENMRGSKSTAVSNREVTSCAEQEPEESWRNKQLPAGMKIKKRTSDEERKNSGSGEVAATGAKDTEASNANQKFESIKQQQMEKNLKSYAQGVHNKEERVEAAPDTVQTVQSEVSQQTPPQKAEGIRHKTSAVHCVKQNITSKETVTSAVDSQLLTSTKKTPSPQPAKADNPNSTLEVPNGTQATESNPSQEKTQKSKSSINSPFGEFSDEDNDVQLVSVQPGPVQASLTPTRQVQKTLTSYAGFQPASKVKSKEDPRALHSQLTSQLKQKKATLSAVNVSALPDKGERLKSQVKQLEEALDALSLTSSALTESQDADREQQQKPVPISNQSNPFSRPGGTRLLAEAPVLFQQKASVSSLELHLSQGYTQMYGVNPENQAFYGGRMTENRLLAVRNATTEAIDHLHNSLESCPSPDAEAEDPKGIKVQLLPHQRRALAWLLWRETQNPCGGILADDMGLGKTLTMIALILAQRKKKEEKDTKLEGWISKNDSSLVASQGTLIICPASLLHHWKKEIEKHVKNSRLSVCLYHGPNRQKSASVLAEHDVVVTTYSLVSKEIPVQKEDAERPSQDTELTASEMAPLLRVAWARVVLDEAHNIKNPKVQTSMAVCKLRARARWAVTGTPIQNNLLDMYSLLKFLRCSPFDEYKLWKAQVDNGSKRGGERLNILTRSLLLRRTKDQKDSTGAPLVSLPDRTCEVHRVKLSEDEQSVYDVVFAQSRSTLQSYLNRHEGGDAKQGHSGNPFEKVAREFGMSQQESVSSSQNSQKGSSTIHILSLLLRLRQCCCHLSLLKKTLDQSELQGDGIALSLEEQLCALSLSEPSQSDPKATVSLNGSRFRSELFEESRESTKISAILSELKEIRKKNQKSVVVSQWTSMLQIVAVHLKKMGLHFEVIDGKVNPKRRMDLVEEFNTNPKGPQVMLVSLCAGGVGINLTGGNHLFLIDMHWNPALEDQACDRIYRVGQRLDVTIHRFVCEGTVEDKISSLQEKKKELAQKVLSGTGSSFTKLSLADLRVIFGV